MRTQEIKTRILFWKYAAFSYCSINRLSTSTNKTEMTINKDNNTEYETNPILMTSLTVVSCTSFESWKIYTDKAKWQHSCKPIIIIYKNMKAGIFNVTTY